MFTEAGGAYMLATRAVSWNDRVNDPETTGYMPYAFVAPNDRLYVCYTDLGPDPGIEDDYGYFTSIE